MFLTLTNHSLQVCKGSGVFKEDHFQQASSAGSPATINPQHQDTGEGLSVSKSSKSLESTELQDSGLQRRLIISPLTTQNLVDLFLDLCRAGLQPKKIQSCHP